MTQLSFLEILERPTVDALIKPEQIFDSEDWKFITEQPENTRFERKSARAKAEVFAICLSAFGNGPAVEGGVVAIGIENDGAVTGCKSLSNEKIQNLEFFGRDHCAGGRFKTRRVAVRNKNGEEDFIILVRVYFVDDKLVELTNGDAYCRESDRSRKLTDAEKQEVRINKGERAFELEPCPLEWPDDFRQNIIDRFVKTVRDARDGSDEIDRIDILEAMRLGKVREGKFVPNNVCALMFAKDPQQVFPGSYVHFLRYVGNEEKSGKEYNVIKDRMIQGSLLDVIKDAAATIDANLREFTEFRHGKFYSVPEYPHDAWYELLVNACVHRSYHAKTQPIFVKLFDDRLVISNPGTFMPSINPDNFIHKPRNPFLMFVLREYGEVRCISEGTKRIRRELQNAKLPPISYLESPSSVTATMYNDVVNRTNTLDSEAYKILGEAISFSLDLEERKIINYLAENHKINVSQALRILSTADWHTAKNRLHRLAKRGILDFVTTKDRDPSAHYRLAQKKQ
ncbi:MULTISPECIES: ATP-binding protein [unclassified Rhizobium]|uniref:ATP-binding protein n=1 Tax=Rhizobium TaxID=379 RepID=UPI00084C3C5B|nr:MULTISPECIES: ATP-binding protein [unclassified Rhizobium]OEC93275.1 hypothetical protein A9Z06_09880 [Rhizobium sp. YK2]QYA14159.1 hypothetical protein J5284_08155 [Rhizobium sp. AB2/73]UEQ79909.1 hypothetical protein I8E17_13845 [Rhizobium sp. AB2/73]